MFTNILVQILWWNCKCDSGFHSKSHFDQILSFLNLFDKDQFLSIWSLASLISVGATTANEYDSWSFPLPELVDSRYLQIGLSCEDVYIKIPVELSGDS